MCYDLWGMRASAQQPYARRGLQVGTLMQQTYEPLTHNPNKERRHPRQLTSTQIMFAAILAIGLMLAINFSGRIVADRELRDVQTAVLQEIDLLEREQATLQRQLEFVRSDAYVERWARSEGRMVRSGETIVKPIPAASFSPPVRRVPDDVPLNTSAPEPQNWELWWSLFFDTPPPAF